MDILLKSSSGYKLVPVATKLLERRCVLIDSDINDDLANAVVGRFIALLLENRQDPITLIINCDGGEVESGLLIYDILTSSNVPINTVCAGKAYSMAAVLFAAGSNRYILPHGRLMLHEPQLLSKFGGSSSTIASISKSMLEIKKKINEILSRHTKQTEDEIDKVTEHDCFFTAEEAVNFHLADKIIGFADIMNLIGGDNNV